MKGGSFRRLYCKNFEVNVSFPYFLSLSPFFLPQVAIFVCVHIKWPAQFRFIFTFNFVCAMIIETFSTFNVYIIG